MRRFISEPLIPAGEIFDIEQMATGAPGLPAAFEWRGKTIRVAAIRHTWRQTGKCRHGSPERYVRKHWYEIATTDNEIMEIYFDRHARGGPKSPRWWLFSIRTPENGAIR